MKKFYIEKEIFEIKKNNNKNIDSNKKISNINLTENNSMI